MDAEKNSYKVLIFGAGVLGSLYGAKLQEGGCEVTMVARGQRYKDLKEHGIIIEYFDTGERTTTKVKVLEAMPAEDYYDLCLVPVQKTQLDSALQSLAVNKKIPAFLFMVNNAEGPQALINALGKERVILGFANAGGERDGYTVRLMIAKGKAVTMGELDGRVSERLQKIASKFKAAGIPVDYSRNMDAWLRHHVALVGPLANAMYMAGSCNYKLAENPTAIRKGLRGMREAIRAVELNGFPVEPRAIRLVFAIPDFILVPLARKLFKSELLDIGGARHARNAREEMAKLNDELLVMARKAGINTPNLDELQAYANS